MAIEQLEFFLKNGFVDIIKQEMLNFSFHDLAQAQKELHDYIQQVLSIDIQETLEQKFFNQTFEEVFLSLSPPPHSFYKTNSRHKTKKTV